MKEHALVSALMIYLFLLEVLYQHLHAHQAAIISPKQGEKHICTYAVLEICFRLSITSFTCKLFFYYTLRMKIEKKQCPVQKKSNLHSSFLNSMPLDP